MAKIGLREPKYSVVTVSESDGVETESYGTAKVFAKAVSMTTSINVNKNKFYADDGVAESDPEFISGSMTMVTDDLEDSVHADISGATLESTSNTITDKDTDSAPYVRFSAIVRRVKGGASQYKAVLFTRLQFDVPADDYETKGESIVYKSTTLTAEIMKNPAGEWRKASPWGTLAEARTWRDANVAPSSSGGGSGSGGGGSSQGT